MLLHYFAYNLNFSANSHIQNWCFSFRTSLTEECSDTVAYNDYKSCGKEAGTVKNPNRQDRLIPFFNNQWNAVKKQGPYTLLINLAFYHELCWLNPEKYKYSKNLRRNYHNNVSAFLLTLRRYFLYLFLNLVINNAFQQAMTSQVSRESSSLKRDMTLSKSLYCLVQTEY